MLRLLAVSGVIMAAIPASALEVGQKASNYRLEDSSGKPYTLNSFKENVLIFWYEG
ncbi:MAG: hypothetical protein GY788_24420, partial [bacterium]|nr:hypothetical protein [bacterium]